MAADRLGSYPRLECGVPFDRNLFDWPTVLLENLIRAIFYGELYPPKFLGKILDTRFTGLVSRTSNFPIAFRHTR